jgi:hypothetical protein
MTRTLFVIRLSLTAGCLLTILSVSPSADSRIAQPSSVPLIIQKAFRPYGYYSLVGKHPKGLESFDTIQYWRKDQEQSGPDISERLAGVTADEGVLYRYSAIQITRLKFIFTTVKVKGIHYSFSGRFLRTDFVNADMDFDKPVAVGTLSKYRNGLKVAAANVKLSYFAGT